MTLHILKTSIAASACFVFLGGCPVNPNAQSDGLPISLSLHIDDQLYGTTAPGNNTPVADYGCQDGNPINSSFEDRIMVPAGSEVRVNAADDEGVAQIIVEMASVDPTDPSPTVSNIAVVGLPNASIQPEVTSAPGGPNLTAVRVDFTQIAPSDLLTARTLTFDLVVPAQSYMTVTALPPASNGVALPANGTNGTPQIIKIDDRARCVTPQPAP